MWTEPGSKAEWPLITQKQNTASSTWKTCSVRGKHLFNDKQAPYHPPLTPICMFSHTPPTSICMVSYDTSRTIFQAPVTTCTQTKAGSHEVATVVTSGKTMFPY